MIRISTSAGDLSDKYLKRITQLGVDAVDLGEARTLPGVNEKGYPDLNKLLEIKKKIHSWGLEINRVSLPDITESFMRQEDGSEQVLENAVRSLQIFGEAGMNLACTRFDGSNFNHLITFYPSVHRGGYQGSGKSLWLTGKTPPQRTKDGFGGIRHARMAYWPHFGYDDPPSKEALDEWWSHFCRAYERLVPVAEVSDVKLGIHPGDIPLPNAPFGSLGFHRIIDTFPNRHVGFLYCCGTRAEAGGLPLVLDEIHNYGRKGRIFAVHFRNVRGSIPTAGGFEEVLLDDGDMNMFKILLELKKVGFDGCLNPDHFFPLEGDSSEAEQGLAYSIGYMKALLAALATI